MITSETLNVPIYIVSFKEKNATVIPILIDDSDYQSISEYSEKSNENVHDFFDTILCGGFYLDYPARRLFEFIQRSKLKSLAIIPYREILDLQHNIGNPILFLNDELIKIDSDYSEQEIHQRINSKMSFNELINNEKKYWSYESSEMYYLKNLNKEN